MTTLNPQPALKVEEGLDFLLSHFKEPLWPRKIATRTTENKQILVKDKTEALTKFKQADYLDCKINAYTSREDWAIELLGQAPEIIFVDQDEHNFRSTKALELTVCRTLKNFKVRLHGAYPTVIHSGNGYHIILPVDGPVLEHHEVFAKLCEDPSNRFHRFAERFLTDNKSDPAHNPTFRSSMLRVPGSINSKNMAAVRIIQKWNGVRPAINWILRDFRRYLIQQKFDEAFRTKHLKSHHNSCDPHQTNNVEWIETLLRTPIEDYRKNGLRLIIAPYLVNIKKLTYEEAFIRAKNWLDECNKLRSLDFNAKDKITTNLRAAIRVGYLPISLNKLKTENEVLHQMLSKGGS